MRKNFVFLVPDNEKNNFFLDIPHDICPVFTVSILCSIIDEGDVFLMGCNAHVRGKRQRVSS